MLIPPPPARGHCSAGSYSATLTLHLFDFSLPGDAGCFKIIKVPLKLDPFLEEIIGEKHDVSLFSFTSKSIANINWLSSVVNYFFSFEWNTNQYTVLRLKQSADFIFKTKQQMCFFSLKRSE